MFKQLFHTAAVTFRNCFLIFGTIFLCGVVFATARIWIFALQPEGITTSAIKIVAPLAMLYLTIRILVAYTSPAGKEPDCGDLQSVLEKVMVLYATGGGAIVIAVVLLLLIPIYVFFGVTILVQRLALYAFALASAGSIVAAGAVLFGRRYLTDYIRERLSLGSDATVTNIDTAKYINRRIFSELVRGWHLLWGGSINRHLTMR